MKKSVIFWMFLALFMFVNNVSFGQFDDLYYDPDADGSFYKNTVVVSNDDEGDYYDEYGDDFGDEYYEDDYYDDYDYCYSNRIRRFHRRSFFYDYYDPFFYDGFYYNPGITVYISSGYYNPWRYRRYRRYDPWYGTYYGGYYGGYNRGYYNGYNDGFYDGYYGNGYYGYDNYYGYNNYYNNGRYYYNNRYDAKHGRTRYYGSRRGLSTVSAKKKGDTGGIRRKNGHSIVDKKVNVSKDRGNVGKSNIGTVATKPKKTWSPFSDRGSRKATVDRRGNIYSPKNPGKKAKSYRPSRKDRKITGYDDLSSRPKVNKPKRGSSYYKPERRSHSPKVNRRPSRRSRSNNSYSPKRSSRSSGSSRSYKPRRSSSSSSTRTRSSYSRARSYTPSSSSRSSSSRSSFSRSSSNSSSRSSSRSSSSRSSFRRK